MRKQWPNLGPELRKWYHSDFVLMKIRTGCFKVGRATFCTLPLVGRCYQTLFRAHTRLKGMFLRISYWILHYPIYKIEKGSILLSIIRSSNLGFGGAIKVGREG